MRFFNKTQVKIVFVILFLFTISYIYFQSVLFSRLKTKSENDLLLFTSVLRPTKDSPVGRRVTKSLSELAKSTLLSDHVLMFNRVPGSGSEIFVLILQWLQGRNSFKHVRLAGGISRRLTHLEQKDFSKSISNTIREQAVPLSFDRSVYFTNFSQFGYQSPTFFNLVRDPIDQYIASVSSGDLHSACRSSGHSGCLKLNSTNYNYTIPFFCGHSEDCLKVNNKWALNKAKKNVEMFFPVVGVLEHINETLILIEDKLSLFFRGAHKIYIKKMSGSRKKWKQKDYTKDVVKSDLRTALAMEYDFYYWIKARLFDQVRIYTSNGKKKVVPQNQLINFQIEQP